MRIPRKLKKQIPKGHYCYTYLEPFYNENGNYGGYHIKLCPFYKNIKIKDLIPRPTWMDQEYVDEFGEELESWCSLVKTDILDQCKSCGEKY